MSNGTQTVKAGGSQAALQKDADLRARRADSARHADGEREESPVLILTISNGAGHVRTAQGIAAALKKVQPRMPSVIADVADYMTPLARFTHVTAYLWIVKHAPAAWDRIDRYQKQQTHTSPEWFYRRTCRALFELARRVRPRALVATEVGCCEIAALVKRDLALDAPLVAVNNDPDADRAWVKPEVDLYCFATDECGDQLIAHGAARERVRVWGASLAEGFDGAPDHAAARAEVCRRLKLDPNEPLILVAGGGEGLGRIEETTARLLRLKDPEPQIVVLAGRNARLRARCEKLARGRDAKRLRVLGWAGAEEMPKLMSAADLMVSKLGSMFHEAIAVGLPIIALKPPPGAERVQYRLLGEWGIGCSVRTLDEAVENVARLLADARELSALRERVRACRRPDAAHRIALWLESALGDGSPRAASRRTA